MTTINPRRRTVPIIPETILKRHNVHEASDTRFRAAARLMQSLWRDHRGHPIGRQDDTRGQGRKLGSRLTPALAQAGANFINPAIATLARREVAYREISAVMDTKRLFGNLLSSQALTINLLGVLKLDLEVATGVFSRLFPTTVAQVEDIWFDEQCEQLHLRCTYSVQIDKHVRRKCLKDWWARRDLNPQPDRYERPALTKLSYRPHRRLDMKSP